MTFSDVASGLGLGHYPPELDRYLPVPRQREPELCTPELIRRLQDRFDLFGEYYPRVEAGYEDLANDPLRRMFLDAVSLYMKDAPLPPLRMLPYPPCENTPASNMLPLLVHLPAIESAYEQYRRRV